ncbi:MAG: hypothetical protein Q9206_002230, partial [Seirophora lacunosa]
YPTAIEDFIKMDSFELREPLSTRTLSTREQIIILEASKLHGCRFPPWVASPEASEFELGEAQSLFVDNWNICVSDHARDNAEFRLSETQLALFDGWRRPDELLPPPSRHEPTTNSVKSSPTDDNEKADLVQDVTSDCSVVASLCACVARAERGHPSMLSFIFHPYDKDLQQPLRSRNGKYIFRLYFNGCWRKVVIDDRLPASAQSRTLYVVDRNNPSLLWPALVEKAYLKVRGGYDFPGSNSGSDLWVLTGWIPEQIFLHSEQTEREALWRRILKSFDYGDVLITLGTGKLTEFEQKNTALASEHDYAVIGLQENRGKRLFLLKNPWSEGNKGPDGDGNGDHGGSKQQGATPEAVSSRQLKGEPPTVDSGTFWMNVNDVFQHFETLYLNWNPGLFSHRQDVHFSWDVSRNNGLWASFRNNPQYQIHSKAAGTVWLVLSRHLKSPSEDRSNADKGSVGATAIDTGFISLYLFRKALGRVILTDGFAVRGPYVDSPNTLVKIDLPGGIAYTVVVSEQQLHRSSHSFTLSAFSLRPLSITEARNKYRNLIVKDGAWTAATAGGNASSLSYSRNPQFTLHLPQSSHVSLLLELHAEEFPVHVKLMWSNGKTIRFVATRDIAGDSGEYRKGHAFAEVFDVPAGRYTIICSTFERGQLGSFTLEIGTMSTCAVERTYATPAGQFVFRPSTAFFAGENDRLWAPLRCFRLSRISIVAQSHGGRVGSSGLPLKLSVEKGQGLVKRVLAISGNDEFSNGHYGVEINDVDVEPSMCTQAGVWIVLERAGPLDLHDREGIDVELYSDANVEIGSWN